MVRVTDALAELRQIILSGRPIDDARCRRLVLRATSRISSLERAAEIADELCLMIPSIEIAEIIGIEREPQVDLVMELLDEIEEASRPNKATF